VKFWRLQGNIQDWGIVTQAKVRFAPEFIALVVSRWSILSMFCDLELWGLKYPRSFDCFEFIQPLSSLQGPCTRYSTLLCLNNLQTVWFWSKNETLSIAPDAFQNERYHIKVLFLKIRGLECSPIQQNIHIYTWAEWAKSSPIPTPCPQIIFFKGPMNLPNSYCAKFRPPKRILARKDLLVLATTFEWMLYQKKKLEARFLLYKINVYL
jgi:hypothetical protein